MVEDSSGKFTWCQEQVRYKENVFFFTNIVRGSLSERIKFTEEMLPEIFDSSDKPFEVFVEERFYFIFISLLG